MLPSTPGPRRSRARAALAWLFGGLAVLVVWTLALPVAVLLHLNVPSSRRAIAGGVTSALASSFRGRLILERVGRVGLAGVEGVRVRVLDPEGRQVILADGVAARAPLLDVARSALFGSGPLAVRVREVSIDYVDASVDADDSGALRVQRAFEPAAPSPPSEPSGRGIALTLERVGLERAWAHGRMSSGPPVDADLHGLEARVAVTPELTRIDADRVGIVTRGPSAEADVEAHLALPSASGGDLGLVASVVGRLGASPVAVQASLDGTQVDVVAEVRRARPEDVRALLPEAPLYADVDLHAEAHGSTERLAVSADGQVGTGGIALQGDVVLGDDLAAHASVWARGIDVRSFSESAPASSLGADVRASVELPHRGRPHGAFEVDTVPGRISGQLVPRANVRGTFTDDTVRGQAHVAEPGAPADASFDLSLAPAGVVADVAARVSIPHLERVGRLGGAARGRADLRASARIDLGNDRIAGEARAEIHDASTSGQRLEHAALDARLGGSLEAPVVDARLRATDIVAGNVSIASAEVLATGPIRAPTVRACLVDAEGSRAEARGVVDTTRGVSVKGAAVSVARGGETAGVTVDLVRIADGEVAVEGATLTGLGEPAHASVRMAPSGMTVRADAPDLDLARLARLARLERALKSGHLAVDADLTVRRDDAMGHAMVEVTQGQINDVRLDGRVDATLMDRRLFANVSAKVPGIGVAYLNTSTLELGGPILDARSWREASGKVAVEVEADLAKVAAHLPAGTLPLGELAGRVTLVGEVGRQAGVDAPELSLSLRTKGLVVASAPEFVDRVDGTRVARPPRWRSSDVDLLVDATAASPSGQTHVEARLVDRHGLVVAVDGSATVPYRDLISESFALARVESAPFDLRIWTAHRELGSLPRVFKTSGMKGAAELSVRAQGTMLEPKVRVALSADGLGTSGSSKTAATAGELVATYDGDVAEMNVSMRQRAKEVLQGGSRVHIRARDLLDPPPGELPWDASALARFDRFPLQSVPPIADMRVRGHLSGEVGLADLHRDARAQAKLRFDDLKIGQASFQGGFVNAKLDREGLDATARLDQQGGFGETHAKIGMTWGRRLAPVIDEKRAAELSVKAKDLRAAALLPFTQGVFSELDGGIDADAQIVLGADKKPVKMSGRAQLRHGVFEVASLGEQFRDAKATVTLSPDGVLRVEDVSARGTTGELLASGVARLDGLGLAAARAAVRIPQDRPIPLMVEGTEMGTISGDVRVDAKVAANKKSIDVVVDVPTLEVRVPEGDTRKLQTLEPDPAIRVGVHRAPGQLTLVPLGPPVAPRSGDATQLNVQVRLGSNVEVRRGRGVRVRIEGSPTFHVAEETRASGQLRLRGGTLDVQGKQFEIEKGTITFTGEPDNPIVVVTAGWTAPEGTRVFADFVGPLKTGKVTLRSEPSLPRNEILSLILFGTPGGTAPTAPGQEPSGATRAAGLGGGIVTQGLNRAMDDLTGLDVTARVDTTDSQNPRPELEVRIAKNLSLQIAYVLGVPPPGTNPDRSLVTLDWRLYRDISLETTVGDRGSSIVDLVWRKRY